MKISLWVWGAGGVLSLVAGCASLGAGAKPGETTLAKGTKTVASPIHYTPAREGLPQTRIWKTQFAFGDVNGDGFADFGVVSRLADGPWIFVGDGKGNWKAFANGLPREPFCGGGMDFADINKDGKMDVVIADHCKGVFAFFGDGEGNWREASSGLPSIGAEDVAAGDFDGDGCIDLASVAAQEEGVRAFRGNCKGVWKESSDGLSITDWGNAIEMKDVNGDGKLDVIAAYSGGPRVWLGNGKGGWEEASTGLPAPEIHGLFWGIAAGDLNGDGKLDVVSGSQMPPQPVGCGAAGAPVCTAGGVEAWLQQADGTWVGANAGLLPMNALGVAIGDLNNDGHADIVAAGKRALNEIGGVYGVFPFLGDGKGNWTPVEESGLPAAGRERTWGVGLADIDRDGVLDVGVAFGDVVSAGWRSGSQGKAAERGKFGSLEVWRGSLAK